MIDKDVIKSQQIQILESVFATSKLTPIFDTHKIGVLETAALHGPKISSLALGPWGISLYEFASSVDLDNHHPDLSSIYDGQLVGMEEGSFSRTASDLICLASRSMDISSYVTSSFVNIIYKHPSWDLVEFVGSPFKTLCNVRFLKNRSDRDSIRALKKEESVRGKSNVDLDSSDLLSRFVRHNNIYEHDIEEANKRIKHLNKFGLTSMSDDVQKYIEAIEDKIQKETCFGFNRLSLPDAASLFLKEQKDIDFFIPSSYPFHFLAENASKNIQDVINHLETFPELKGKPVFDHYRVLLMGQDDLGAVFGEKDGNHYFICYWESEWK
jgi:hypothetical protein